MEYSTVRSIQHENIIRSKDYFEDNDYIIIVYELMSSDLHSLLKLTTGDEPLYES